MVLTSSQTSANWRANALTSVCPLLGHVTPEGLAGKASPSRTFTETLSDGASAEWGGEAIGTERGGCRASGSVGLGSVPPALGRSPGHRYPSAAKGGSAFPGMR
jgi:hypothetical protein